MCRALGVDLVAVFSCRTADLVCMLLAVLLLAGHAQPVWLPGPGRGVVQAVRGWLGVMRQDVIWLLRVMQQLQDVM